MLAFDTPVRILLETLASEGPSTHAHVKLAEHEMQGTSARGMLTAKAVTDATAPLTAAEAAFWAAF
ncbi:MAG: hypothetical protein WAM90_04185, partial [Rhodanobacter sp.]